MAWTIKFARNTIKDAEKLRAANLTAKLSQLVEILKQNPYQPPYEKLSGNLQGYYSRRINIKHRLAYSIDEQNKLIKVVSVWSHYGE
ncbi:MAG: Txe/YoeB family addiction module toxin [Cyanobacteria bacterium J06600_6]